MCVSLGARFLAAYGSLAGQISIADDFEFTDEELDEMLDHHSGSDHVLHGGMA